MTDFIDTFHIGQQIPNGRPIFFAQSVIIFLINNKICNNLICIAINKEEPAHRNPATSSLFTIPFFQSTDFTLTSLL